MANGRRDRTAIKTFTPNDWERVKDTIVQLSTKAQDTRAKTEISNSLGSTRIPTEAQNGKSCDG